VPLLRKKQCRVKRGKRRKGTACAQQWHTPRSEIDFFNGPVGVDQLAVDGPAGDGEILDRPERVDSPEHLGRNVPRAQQIGFLAVAWHGQYAQRGEGAT